MRNSSHLILGDSLVNQTRQQKSARANVTKIKTLKYSTNVPSFPFHFLFSVTAVLDASANVLVSPTKLSDVAARLSQQQLPLLGFYAFKGDETRHMFRLITNTVLK